MATISKGNPNTQEKDPNDSSERPKREKHKSLSQVQKSDRVLFFPSQKSRSLLFSSSLCFYLRAGLGGDVYKGGRDHETHNQKKEWVSTP